MTLNELIESLKKADPALVVKNGFENPHSYRGHYAELAFEPAENVTVAHMLQQAYSALGATYTGWKGGEYTMDGDSPVWVAPEGEAVEEPLTKAGLTLMLGAGSAEIDREKLARSIAIELYRAGLLESLDASVEAMVRGAIDQALDGAS